MAKQHIIPPTFFWPGISIFEADYDCYIKTGVDIDALGNRHDTYTKQTIKCSLQRQVRTKEQDTTGNKVPQRCNFYCKSIFRLDIDDYIFADGQYFIVKEMQPYDEYGCREGVVERVDIRNNKDLMEYIKYLEGDELI